MTKIRNDEVWQWWTALSVAIVFLICLLWRRCRPIVPVSLASWWSGTTCSWVSKLDHVSQTVILLAVRLKSGTLTFNTGLVWCDFWGWCWYSAKLRNEWSEMVTYHVWQHSLSSWTHMTSHSPFSKGEAFVFAVLRCSLLFFDKGLDIFHVDKLKYPFFVFSLFLSSVQCLEFWNANNSKQWLSQQHFK